MRQEVMHCWCGYITLLNVLGDYYPFKVYFQCGRCRERIKKVVEKKDEEK